MRRGFVIVWCAVIGAALLSPCHAQNHTARYISLAPSTTEILFALGLGDEVVGISSYCNYPPESKSKASVGDFSSPNIEKILSLRPDYIFCTGLEQNVIIVKLRSLHLKVYVADPATIEELFASIRDIGALTGRRSRADDLVAGMRKRLQEVAEKLSRSPAAPKPKVFIEIWHDPLMTAGKGSFVDEVVSLAGGVNIAHDAPRPYSIFSAEEVVRRNPDIIIMGYMEKDPAQDIVKRRFGWSSIGAVRNNKVYNDIDPDMLLRPGPRVVDAVEALYKRLYP